jgi:ABC-2 type transport system permease protein
MSNIVTLIRRELAGSFLSPLAYVTIFLFLLFNGYVFGEWLHLLQLLGGGSGVEVSTLLGSYLGSPVLILLLGLLAPVLTFRSLAGEKSSGTLEMLLTAPVTDSQLVVAKFLGAFLFYAVITLSTSVYVLYVVAIGGLPDWGVIASAYTGVLLLGAMLIAINLFFSSITTNMVVALIVSIFVNLALLLVPGFLGSRTQDPFLVELADYLDLFRHFQRDFGAGIVDTRHLVYYGTTMALGLFLTLRAVELRKWR